MDLIDTLQQTLTLVETQEIDLQLTPLVDKNQMGYGLIVLIIYLSLIATMKLVDGDMFKQINTNMFSFKSNNVLLSYEISSLGFFIVMQTISFATIGIGVSYLVSGKPLTMTTLLVTIALFGLQVFYTSIIRILGWTFNKKSVAVNVVSYYWISNSTIGVLCSPLIISIFFVRPEYANKLIMIAGAIIFLLLILRLIHWVKILFENRVSVFYMILYLCTLEIVPALTMIKLLGL